MSAAVQERQELADGYTLRYQANDYADLVAFIVCTGLPTWSMLAGVVPLLIVAACLLPYLLLLIFFAGIRVSRSAPFLARSRSKLWLVQLGVDTTAVNQARYSCTSW